jgi:OOP family OmpA-OmpF porin
VTSPVVAAQIALIKNQSEAKEFFTAIPKVKVNVAAESSSSPRASQINNVGVLTSINTQSAITNSLQTANFKLPATDIVLSDLVVKSLELQVKLVATDTGFSVAPVAGFTGILVIPIVATIDGVQITVLNRVVVNPVAPVAIGFSPKSVKESSIAWTQSMSQVVAYVVEINGKTACQTTSNTCPVPALIGPNSKVTISAIGNDQTTSTSEVIPYVAKAPIPALKVNFATGSAKLTNEQKSEIRTMCRLIGSEGFTRLVVNGFTDIRGSVAANAALSKARANAVAAYMQDLLPEISIKASAYGSKNALGSNTTKNGQSQNRRTEVSTW